MLRNANNADSTRESIRVAYRKHVKLARTGRIPSVDSTHSIGLFAALASRYRVMGKEFSEPAIYAELAPFLCMDELESVEALAEYIVHQERPGEARLPWLKEAINRSLSVATGRYAGFAALGVAGHVRWSGWLGEKAMAVIKTAAAELERGSAKSPQEPETVEEWQEAVNIVQALLIVHDARTKRAFSDGSNIDAKRCNDTLLRGKQMGIVPQPDRVRKAVKELQGHS